MKNNFLGLNILAVLIVLTLASLKSKAADVENPVIAGEKYVCDIETTDGKKYLLDLVWNLSKPINSNDIDELLKYELKNKDENMALVDFGEFSKSLFKSSSSFSNEQIDLNLNTGQKNFTASKSQSTRVGNLISLLNVQMNSNRASLELTKFEVCSYTKKFNMMINAYSPENCSESGLKIKLSICNLENLVKPNIK